MIYFMIGGLTLLCTLPIVLTGEMDNKVDGVAKI